MKVMVTRQKLELEAALRERGYGALKQLDLKSCGSLLQDHMKP